MEFLPYVWLALIVLAAIVEAGTSQLVSIWFVAGGIAALIASMLGAPFAVQLTLYIVVTAVTLIITRPMVKKFIYFKKEDTNAGRCIGEIGVVLQEINNINAVGEVKVQGKVWSARTADGSSVPVGALVRILRIEGVKLIVERKN